MSGDFISRAFEATKGLKLDLAALDTIIADAEESRSRIRQQIALYDQALAVYRQVMDLPRTPEEQLPLIGGLSGTIADMAAQVIEAKGGRVTVRELVDILTAAGKFRNPEKDRQNYGTVYGTLQRDDRFSKVPKKGEFFLIEDRSPETALRPPTPQ